MRPTVARRLCAAVAVLLCLAAPLLVRPSNAAEPITIGFAEALTGNLAVVGKSGLLAEQIWAQDVNAKGGLLGRPVKLIYYDNQSNPANVPGIYTKLLDVDHVDLVVSPYATNMTAPAMPIAMAHGKTFISVFCLAVNSEFHYPRYFAMLPTGPDPMHAFSKGYFDLAMRETPKPAPSQSLPPMPSSRAMPRAARATTPRRPGCALSMTALIRPPPPTTHRSCGQSAPPIPTSSTSPPIPPIPPACCARCTRSASRRGCSVATWWACRPRQ